MGPRVSAQTRLVAAVSTSGLVLGALAGARLEHPWWAAALAPVPLLVAARCLPLPLALPLVMVVGLAARLVGALSVAESTLATSAIGAAALALALLADRAGSTRWPRLGALAFPLSVVALDAGLGALEQPARALPVASAGLAATLHAGLGVAAPPLACAALAVALAGLACIGNWHRQDPLPRELREASARQVAVGAVLTVGALFAAAKVLTSAGG